VAALGAPLLSAGLGCDSDPTAAPPAGSVRPAHDSAAAIPTSPIEGKLRGQPFVVRDARYRVDRRPGHEHVDILLSDGEAKGPCGDLEPAEPPRIWLRRQGAAPLASQEIRIAQGQAAGWEAHYQLRQNGRWVAAGDGAAWLRLDVPDAGFTVRGALSVCFADGAGSCAAGAFVAHACPTEIDRPVRGVGPTESPEALLQQGSSKAPTAKPAPAADGGL
jgi:hypothetical protein